MTISSLPGYIQGYKFTDSAAFYDPTGNYFIDQAGFSANPASRAEVVVGTPNFVDVNAARGIECDNSFHIYFNMPIISEGSIIAVWGAPGFVSAGTENITLITCNGNTSNFSANTKLYLGFFSSVYSHYLTLASSVSAVRNIQPDSGIYADCFVMDPTIGTKRPEAMNSAGTISTGATIADNNIGYTLGGGGTASYDEPGTRTYREIIGNINFNPASVAPLASGNTLTLCELHFFDTILTASPTTAVETELLALEAIYG